jgi:hypothetical protein
MLTDAQLDFDRKKRKKNNFREHRTYANRRLKPHPQKRLNRRRYA